MAFLELHDIDKSFGKNKVVKKLSLSVGKGEFVSLLGGSGCGKTTTLRMIAGFETPDSGSILVDGRDVAKLPPNKRKLGMVFQNYALFPNMTVKRNIAFGLAINGMARPDIDKRVAEMLEVIHMGDFGDRYPHQLSGGQQQRVALARALAPAPAALLLDEPLSALDAKIRIRLRDDIRAIQQRLGITTIYVTHDQEEALSISDRVAVMKEGLIEQIGSPFQIYNSPATPYVATFIGTLNALPAVVTDPAAGRVEIEGQAVEAEGPIAQAKGSGIILNLRPEALALAGSQDADGATNRLKGRVVHIKFLGSVVRLVVEVGKANFFADCFNAPNLVLPGVGDEATFAFARRSCAFSLTASTGAATQASEESLG